MTNQVDLRSLKRKVIRFGGTDIMMSDRKEKRFCVVFQGKKIHFGAKYGMTYYDHGDEDKRKAWIARHSKIQNKDGEYVMTQKTSPSFWSHKILW